MGGIISGIFGGGQQAPSQPNVQVYQPTGTGQIDTNLQNLLNSNTNAVSGANNPYSRLSPQIQQLFQSLFNAPTAGGYQAAAGNAGSAYTDVGNRAVGASGQLNDAALSLLPGAAQVMQLGLDPQSALYNQQLQKTQDLANVNNAAYGLTGQQAAGNVNQADSNFNIDWQNTQLQRALAGLQGGSNAITSASGNAINASNLGTSGAGNILAGGATPYNAATNIYNNQQTALQDYITQLLGPVTSSQSTINQLQQYLNPAIQASEGGAAAALADYKAQNDEQSSLGGGLANLLGLGNGGGSNMISSIFGGGSGGGGGNSGLGGVNFGNADVIPGGGGGGGSGSDTFSQILQYIPMIAELFA